jgi:hypothetical protein
MGRIHYFFGDATFDIEKTFAASHELDIVK